MQSRILHGDCRQVLRDLPAESVHCVVTSPPYWGNMRTCLQNTSAMEHFRADRTGENRCRGGNESGLTLSTQLSGGRLWR